MLQKSTTATLVILAMVFCFCFDKAYCQMEQEGQLSPPAEPTDVKNDAPAPEAETSSDGWFWQSSYKAAQSTKEYFDENPKDLELAADVANALGAKQAVAVAKLATRIAESKTVANTVESTANKVKEMWARFKM